jgi:uncharacterized protein (DUF58 family)
MRPSLRLLFLALLCFAISTIAVTAGGALANAATIPWLLLGFALAVDLVAGARFGIGLQAGGPTELFVGADADLSLRIEGGPSGDVACRIEWPGGLNGVDDAVFKRDEASGDLRVDVPFRAQLRGVWRIERAWLRWTGRLGLIEFTPRVPLGLEVTAVPDIRPVSSGIIDVQVRSELFGIKENLVRGEGSDFHQLREFTSGMDPRSIDWKRSARSRSLVAKEMRAERNHHVILALDNGYLMRQEIAGLPKIDHAVNAALATAWAAVVGGDQVGVLAYDAIPRLSIPPTAGRGGFARLRTQLAGLSYESRESNHTLGMALLHRQLARRALVIVFSDFVDSTTAEILVENLRVLGRRHVVIFVTLRDPEVEAIGAAPATSLDDAARSVSATELIAERRLVMERLTRLGILVLDVAPERATPRLISTYLDLKAREVI